MGKEIINSICDRIADGEELYYSEGGKYYVFYKKVDCIEDMETGREYVFDRRKLKPLPVMDLKEEALNFIEENKNLYFKKFSSLFYKIKDKKEAAWATIVAIEDEGDGTIWGDFFDYRREKAGQYFNRWRKEIFNNY